MGLETVIRPVVNPDFRPRQRTRLDDSDDEPFTMDGGDGKMISLRHQLSVNWSNTVETETRRIYNVMRIHNPSDNSQFVDDEVMTKLETRDAKGKIRKIYLGTPPAADNITTISTGNVRINNG